MTQRSQYQAVVIGAGPGGYVAAIRLGQLGIQTAIVEKGELGGVCLNVGCIPSKALIEVSKKFSFLNSDDASMMGIKTSSPTLDMGAAQKWKGNVVKKLTTGVGALLKANGVDIIRGTASFISPTELAIQEARGKKRVIRAENVILATGSRPIQIPGFEFDETQILSSTGALALPKVPKRLVVIGGGYIGLEMGGVYARMGSKVTIVEMADQILPGLAKDLVQPVAKSFRKLGAEIQTGARALGYVKSRGVCKVQIQTRTGTKEEITADAVLVTVGRRPNTENLGLEKLGITLDAQGRIPVNEQMQSAVHGIYAIGDIVEGPTLAHKASREGEVAAEVIAGHKSAMDAVSIPAVIFTEPEIATTGLSESQAKEAGYTPKVGKFPFAANGRALTTGKADGFVRVISDAESDVILGVEIVGPQASDLIAEATLGLEMGAFTLDMGLTIHAHPTLAEGLMEAANAVRGEAVHMVNR